MTTHVGDNVGVQTSAATMEISVGLLKKVKTGLPSYATPGICPNTAYPTAEILANPCSLLPYSIARKENQLDAHQWIDG